MEKELARFLMNHLLENYFSSKKELADELDVSKRNVQRILNGTSSTQKMILHKHVFRAMLCAAAVFCFIDKIRPSR